MATFQKRIDAPAGPITVTLGDNTYVFGDLPDTEDALSEYDAEQLRRNPYLEQVGFDAPPTPHTYRPLLLRDDDVIVDPVTHEPTDLELSTPLLAAHDVDVAAHALIRAALLKLAGGRIAADAPTGGAATDTAMLNDWMASIPPGGAGLLHTASDTPYVVENAPLTITRNMDLSAHALTEVHFAIGEPNNAGSGEWPSKSPHLRGCVLMQATPALPALRVIGDALNVNLRNIGGLMAPGHRFVNTGHVFEAKPATAGNHGLLHSRWENVRGMMHDGNHYAFLFENPLMCTFDGLRGYGGGMIQIIGDAPGFNYGNLVFIHPYGKMFVGGTAHGYSLRGIAGHLNIIVFIRPQLNIGGKPSTFPEIVASPALGQDYFRADDPVAVGALAVYSGDFEGAGYAALIRFGSGRKFITPEGFFGTDPTNKEFIIMSNPKGGSGLASDLEQTGLLIPVTSAGTAPTFAVGGGAGTGAVASIANGSTDFKAQLFITTGTSPNGASGQVAGTLTFAVPSRVKNLTAEPTNLAAATAGRLVNVSGLGATASLRFTGAGTLAASTLHSWVLRGDGV